MSSLRRALLLAAMVSCAAPAGASAATRMYVSTAREADGSASVSAYAFDGVTQVMDTFRLDVVRSGGPVVATDTQPGFVMVTPALEVGDELVLTDTTTSATRTVVYTGQPALVAPACGAASFSGTREDGSTVDVSSGGVATVQFFGAGTTFAGAFSHGLAAGATVKVSQARAIDPAFTVFDAVSAVVGDACPVAETPKQTTTVPAAAPAASAAAPAPVVPVVTPPVADTVAPAGRATVRTPLKSAYQALVGGTFSSAVAVSEPARITQTLAAGKTVLGTGTATAAKPGTVTVRVKLSKNGRRRLVRAKTITLVLTTVLRDAAGNARTLPARRFVVKRRP
ncbi:MAG TPA: hypothetical protein VNT55_02955 [Baekduia sp.]|nr:hypothetical protein [Baekduia sp.]